ncbi:hypothetical protein DITRI_Ditri04bG0053300 [Diplodiscus trichospermus]
MDVFISCSVKGNGDKDTTFAFVRFLHKFEMMNAIHAGNNRRIDGWYITVKEVAYGWKEWRLKVNNQYQDKREKVSMGKNLGGGSSTFKDSKSYAMW